MNTFLTRNDILELKDITTKELRVPDTIPVWGGKGLYIKQLTRGMQDTYLKRQFGSLKMKQEIAKKNRNVQAQEMSAPDIYGHDAWLCVHAICDMDGQLLFNEQDIQKLNEKSGEAIGWIAKEILEFSKMTEDVDALQQTETDVKN